MVIDLGADFGGEVSDWQPTPWTQSRVRSTKQMGSNLRPWKFRL